MGLGEGGRGKGEGGGRIDEDAWIEDGEDRVREKKIV